MTKLNLVAEPGKHDIIIKREFNASREKIFKVLTDPKLVSEWWGPRDLTTVVDEMDVRMGGIWRYVQSDADGNSYAFRGVYHQVSAPECLVFTFEFEEMPGHILLETVTLTEENGKTTLTDVSVFQSIADRDGMVASGMESGAQDSWDRLEEVLATL
ncbi:MAG: SRPBCC family protein [Aggregatilineales bacterium]